MAYTYTTWSAAIASALVTQVADADFSGILPSIVDYAEQRLYRDLEKLSNKQLVEDWQRTVILVVPDANQPSNSVWRYYWTVRNQMEKRSESIIERARKLAGEEQ